MPPRPARQERRAEADAFGALAGAAVADLHPRHRHRADPGLDLTLGTMAVAHQTRSPVRQTQSLPRGQERLGLKLHRLGEKPTSAHPQHLGQRIVHIIGLAKTDNIDSFGHGVSLSLERFWQAPTPASIRRLPHPAITHFQP